MVDLISFAIPALIVLVGGIGVVAFRNPVHNALALLSTLFAMAILFMSQGQYFLAAVQVIVYGGAIVVLFLFVIMLLGVDRLLQAEIEPLKVQRPTALVTTLVFGALTLTAFLAGSKDVTGIASKPAGDDEVQGIARTIFVDYPWAFEITSVLLAIAVVASVLLARRGSMPGIDGSFAAVDFEEPDYSLAPEPLDEPDYDVAAQRVADLTRAAEIDVAALGKPLSTPEFGEPGPDPGESGQTEPRDTRSGEVAAGDPESADGDSGIDRFGVEGEPS